MKLCKDCKHLTNESPNRLEGALGPWCAIASVPDYVNGNHRLFSCGTERGFATASGCGPDAKHFEPRDPLAEAAE